MNDSLDELAKQCVIETIRMSGRSSVRVTHQKTCMFEVEDAPKSEYLARREALRRLQTRLASSADKTESDV